MDWVIPGYSAVVEVNVSDLLKIRDALIQCDINEAYHVLYGIACPLYDKRDPWEEWENMLRRPWNKQMLEAYIELFQHKPEDDGNN